MTMSPAKLFKQLMFKLYVDYFVSYFIIWVWKLTWTRLEYMSYMMTLNWFRSDKKSLIIHCQIKFVLVEIVVPCPVIRSREHVHYFMCNMQYFNIVQSLKLPDPSKQTKYFNCVTVTINRWSFIIQSLSILCTVVIRFI